MVVVRIASFGWDQPLPRQVGDLGVALAEDVLGFNLRCVAHVAWDVVSIITIGDGVELVLIIFKVFWEETGVADRCFCLPTAHLAVAGGLNEWFISLCGWPSSTVLPIQSGTLWSRRYLWAGGIQRFAHGLVEGFVLFHYESY